jgi:phage tail-like protein
VTTDFAELLYRSLPGIYRQKDESLELARFLQIMAAPLAETEASIGQLYEDLFSASARGELLPLVGALIGADIDASLPPSLQRAALEETLAFHRNKGLAEPLERTVQAFTGFTTVAVDYSQVVARLPYLETMSPILRRRGRPVGWDAASGNAAVNRFYFDATRKVAALFDEQRGRAIARAQLAAQAAELVGTDRGFGLGENGTPLLGARAPLPLTVVPANLTDFASPLSTAGTALVLTAGQVGVDTELGRFVFAAAAPAGSPPGRQWPPLPGNLTVDFHQLVPTSISTQTFDLRDSARVARLGRSDDPAPYTVDLRSPARPRDRVGRAHFDNHGFFLTVGRRFDSRRPNLLRNASFVGYSFDDRPLDPGNTTGVPLQLQDGFDGSPLTVNDLAGREADYFDAPVGFTVRARGLSLADPAFGAGARVVAARLSDLANPKDPAGQPLTLQPRDLAVDPQWGRFLVNPTSFGVRADEIRVG